MSTKRVFAVDLGASGGKCFAGVFENGGFSLQEVHRFAHEGVSFHIADRSGNLVERIHWDDTLLYQNILQGLRAYRRGVAETVDAIGIDTWGADGHFVSAEGELLGKVYTYRDHHLDRMVEEVKARMDPRRVYEITGIHFQPFNVSNQLLWFVQNRSDLLRPGCFYLPIPSLFYFYLGGVRKVDSSWASVTQLMEAKAKRWSAEILERLGIPPAVLPEIVAPGAEVGRLLAPIAEAVGLNQAPLIAVGSHDTASAFASAPAENTAEALIISSGTWSLIGKLIPEPITTPAAFEANMSNEGGIGNVRFLRNCMGTWLVQELRRGWRDADGREMPWDELNAMTAAAPAFAAFIDPDDSGFYNPPDMEKAMLDFCARTGQPKPAGRGALLRVAYESLALKYRMVNDMICRISGRANRVAHIVGGGCRNAMLNQFAANSLGVPVFAGPEEATAVGNVMVQAVGCGILSSMAEALPLIRRTFAVREFAPQDRAAWDRAYGDFARVTASAGR